MRACDFSFVTQLIAMSPVFVQCQNTCDTVINCVTDEQITNSLKPQLL